MPHDFLIASKELSSDILMFLRQISKTISIVRAPIIIITILFLLLFLAPQSSEVFRAIAQKFVRDLNQDNGWCLSLEGARKCLALIREPTWSFLGMIGLAVSLWFTARRNVKNAYLQVPPQDAITLFTLKAAPTTIAFLCIFIFYVSFNSAIPYNLDDLTQETINSIAKHKDELRFSGDHYVPHRIRILQFSLLVEKVTHFNEFMNGVGYFLIALAILVALISVLAEFLFPTVPAVNPSFLSGNGGLYVFVSYFAITIGILILPVRLSQFFGVIFLLCLFFGLLCLMIGQIAAKSDETNVPLLWLLVAWWAILSLTCVNNNDRIKTEVAKALDQHKTTPLKAQRNLADHLAVWYKSRPDAGKYLSRPYPLYIVAAQGGGIYAALHASRTLGSLQDRCPAFAHHLFAISGVSGGSVGASVFSALRLAKDRSRRTKWVKGKIQLIKSNEIDPPCISTKTSTSALIRQQGSYANAASVVLGRDLLAPLASGLLFPDFVQQFLPIAIPSFDRTRWLEQALVDATEQALEGSGLTAPNYLRLPYNLHWRAEGSTPALVLNTTEVISGKRRIVAPFKFPSADGESRFFPGAADITNPSLSMATAAILSARFPWVTPSGTFFEGDQKLRIVDGGYFDNSGVVTALDLKDAIETSIKDSRELSGRISVKLIILTSEDNLRMDYEMLSEILDPFRAFIHSWTTRGIYNISQAKKFHILSNIKNENIFTINLKNLLYYYPLGWRLADGTMFLMEAQDPSPFGCEGGPSQVDIRQPFSADCALKQIMSDLL